MQFNHLNEETEWFIHMPKATQLNNKKKFRPETVTPDLQQSREAEVSRISIDLWGRDYFSFPFP